MTSISASCSSISVHGRPMASRPRLTSGRFLTGAGLLRRLALLPGRWPCGPRPYLRRTPPGLPAGWGSSPGWPCGGERRTWRSRSGPASVTAETDAGVPVAAIHRRLSPSTSTRSAQFTMQAPVWLADDLGRAASTRQGRVLQCQGVDRRCVELEPVFQGCAVPLELGVLGLQFFVGARRPGAVVACLRLRDACLEEVLRCVCVGGVRCQRLTPASCEPDTLSRPSDCSAGAVQEPVHGGEDRGPDRVIVGGCGGGHGAAGSFPCASRTARSRASSCCSRACRIGGLSGSATISSAR